MAHDPFEGRGWLAPLIDKAQDVPRDLRARALLSFGGLIFIVGEFEHGTSVYEETLAEYTAIGDEYGRAEVLNRLANSALVEDDYVRARALAEEGLEIHRRFGSRKGEAAGIGTIASIEWQTDNHEVALELARRSAALAAEAGFLWWQVAMLHRLSEWSFERGQRGEAVRYGREAVELAHRIGDRMHGVYAVALLARIAAEDGRVDKPG